MSTKTQKNMSSREILDQRFMRIIFAGLVLIVAMVAIHMQSKPNVPQSAQYPILEERAVYLEGHPREGTVVQDENQETIAEFGPGEGGLLETLGTVIRRQRSKHNVTEKTPVLARLHGPRNLTLFDPSTGHSYNMASYGSQNIDHIIKFLIGEG